MHRMLIALALLASATAAHADETTITLKPAADVDLVSSHCAVCHSLDYVQMNAPFLSADGWKTEVGKMRTAFGAPVDDADAAKIIAYLTAQYSPKP